MRFADVPLTDQHGRELRLADAVGERIVVMGFVYTSCTTVCPVISAIMQKVQAQLGERIGAEVGLLSISVDPLRDSPARLLEYSRAYQAGPGWSWLTGQAAAVDETLRGLGVWSADYASHPPTLLVGDGRSGQWTRYYGFTDPAVLVGRVEALAEARRHAGHGHIARRDAEPEGRP
ncbi:protein SCO1/2 [Azotobacter beijerinckii]|uniref:Protein SCO1/2 n=1 Tax=Azotobacter beijerinckii TaxID=170623 RepID=A0A1I4EVJ1_9GAMM|nr:protein SCO1/2 [Azotobacter beijerinckii]SFL08151.1 protein SCO1/2 [Azotobacter beijerinckii]